MSDIQVQSRELLSPILDVMGGVDGGSAYALLQFEVIPMLLSRQDVQVNQDTLRMIQQFSRLCQALLNDKI